MLQCGSCRNKQGQLHIPITAESKCKNRLRGFHHSAKTMVNGARSLPRDMEYREPGRYLHVAPRTGLIESCGIPHLAKNERDMGHPFPCVGGDCNCTRS